MGVKRTTRPANDGDLPPKKRKLQKRNPPTPRPKVEEEMEPLQFPFLDSSSSVQEVEAMVGSELDKIKSEFYFALEKNDSSNASELAEQIGYHLLQKPNNSGDECESKEEAKVDKSFMIKKTLESGDIGNQSRFMFKTTSVEDNILPYMGADEKSDIQSGKGVMVYVYDQDTRTTHIQKFKKWTSCECYVLTIMTGWTPNFVRRRELMKGDEIGLYWDRFYSRLCFSLLKRA